LEDDPIRMLLQRTSGPSPEPLPNKDNYYFNLRLFDLQRGDIEERAKNIEKIPLQDIHINPDKSIFDTANAQVTSILRDMPTLPGKDSLAFTIFEVLTAGREHAQGKGEHEMVQRIRNALEVLERLENEGGYDEIKLLKEMKVVSCIVLKLKQ
jgi:hypothetical protein